MNTFDEKYLIDTFKSLLAIDSTTGQFREIQNWVIGEIERLGFSYTVTHKGGVLADLGGDGNALAIAAHLDDIGLMVRHINADGTLNVCPVGGLYPVYCVGENVRVYSGDGEIYTGTVCRTPNSIHVTEEEIRSNLGDFRKNICVVLDMPVHTAADTKALGIETGDMIALEHRFTMSNGYIKSRFVDDKACAAVLLNVMKTIKEQNITPTRKVYAYFSCYEEIGHGTTWLPADVKDILSIDIAPTGPEQNSEEHLVSIFAKDSRYPYHVEMTKELRDTARKSGIGYVMDVFTPHYGTDGDTSVAAGYDIRHAAIGPGTANSHGYERTHIDGLKNTYQLTLEYILS
ncbi:MAG: M42 family metallopeptidase [Anaerolineaceae bacterium]|nr:M42 family metallopeptidase [Anaerolineaceae bacterium]